MREKALSSFGIELIRMQDFVFRIKEEVRQEKEKEKFLTLEVERTKKEEVQTEKLIAQIQKEISHTDNQVYELVMNLVYLNKVIFPSTSTL
jgi:hypothetical protein